MKTRISLTVTLSALLLAGCSEIFSPDISGESVAINGPADSAFTNVGDFQFWWTENEDIERYRLQIATPNFNIPTLILDTTVGINTVDYTLPEGLYSWRVMGINEGSETGWSTRRVIVDKTTPYIPWALTMDGDTVSASGDTAVLSWNSEDPAISGVRFGIRDSIYVYRRNDSTTVLFSLFKDLGVARAETLDLQNDFSGQGWYHWRIVSYDRAGNRRPSVYYKFKLTN